IRIAAVESGSRVLQDLQLLLDLLPRREIRMDIEPLQALAGAPERTLPQELLNVDQGAQAGPDLRVLFARNQVSVTGSSEAALGRKGAPIQSAGTVRGARRVVGGVIFHGNDGSTLAYSSA